MSDPFVGEIRIFGGNFAPLDWAFCDGRILNISQNEALFSLIGNVYGGDGMTTFALPDLRGRVPIHAGNGYVLGQSAGGESVTIAINQIAAHTHTVRASTERGSQNNPAGEVWAVPIANRYSAGAPGLGMKSSTVGNAGGSQPHDNMMPFLVLNFIISLAGIYPPRN